MSLTQSRYDSLIAKYASDIVEGMDMDSLIEFACDTIEENLRKMHQTSDELIQEISEIYGEDYAKEFVESAMNEDG
jgi:hypothetical protein